MPAELIRQPRRVLVTADAVGGVHRYAVDLAAGLAQRGIETVLVGLGPRPSAAQRAEAEAVAELVWLDQPLDWLVDDPAALEAIPAALARIAHERDVDLLHLNLPTQAAGLRTDLPVVVASHSCVVTWFAAVRGSGLPEGWDWQFDLNARGLQRADVVLAPSRSHAQLMHSVYGRLGDLAVVANSTASRALSSEREPFVFAAGRWWDEGKNGAVLDAAAQHLNWPVRMAGATVGPNEAALDLRHAEALGPLSAPATIDLLSRASIVASPSAYEPFGLVALEAAASGRGVGAWRTFLPIASFGTVRRCSCRSREADAWADAINAACPSMRNGGWNSAGVPTIGHSFLRVASQVDAVLAAYENGDGSRRSRGAGLMRFLLYTHSLVSDWNHGNAHFLRGVLRDLVARGHDALALEPKGAWSRQNMVAERGPEAEAEFHRRVSRSFEAQPTAPNSIMKQRWPRPTS